MGNTSDLRPEVDSSRERARCWYQQPDLVPIARAHDAKVEPLYSAFVADKIADLGLDTPDIIDIGCGEGILATLIDDFNSYIGIDPDGSDLHTNTVKSPDNVQFVRASVEGIPSTVHCADIIVSSLNVALWDDPARRCAELRGRLRPSGHLLIVDLMRVGPRLMRSADEKLSQFLIDQHNVSLAREDVDAICRTSLPGADVSIFEDKSDAIVPSDGATSNYGNLFLIHYRKA